MCDSSSIQYVSQKNKRKNLDHIINQLETDSSSNMAPMFRVVSLPFAIDIYVADSEEFTQSPADCHYTESAI